MSLRVNNSLWLISDTHFGHRNIVRFQQRPATHEFMMLSEWIKLVKDDDQILHLGDVWLRASDWRWSAIISRLPGEKFLIKGNHDNAKDRFYVDAGFTIIDPFIASPSQGRGGFAFTHRPISSDYPDLGRERSELHPDERDVEHAAWHTNIHGHTHSNMFKPEHDGLTFPDKHYINVCVEHTRLAPVRLGNLWN